MRSFVTGVEKTTFVGFFSSHAKSPTRRHWEALPVQGERLSANAKPLSDSVARQDGASLYLKRLALKKNGNVFRVLPLQT